MIGITSLSLMAWGLSVLNVEHWYLASATIVNVKQICQKTFMGSKAPETVSMFQPCDIDSVQVCLYVCASQSSYNEVLDP